MLDGLNRLSDYIRSRYGNISQLYFNRCSIRRHASLLIYSCCQLSLILYLVISLIFFPNSSILVSFLLVTLPTLLFVSLFLLTTKYLDRHKLLDYTIAISLLFDFAALVLLHKSEIDKFHLMGLAVVIVTFHAYYFPSYRYRWKTWGMNKVFGSSGALVSYFALAIFYMNIESWTFSLTQLGVVVPIYFLLVIPVYVQVKITKSDIEVYERNLRVITTSRKVNAIENSLPRLLEISELSQLGGLESEIKKITEILRNYLNVEYAVIGLIVDDSVKDFEPILAYEVDSNVQALLDGFREYSIKDSGVGTIILNNSGTFKWDARDDGYITDNGVFEGKYGYSIPLVGLRTHENQILQSRKIHSLLVEPLVNKQDVIGYICLINKINGTNPLRKEKQFFSESDVQNVHFLGSQISLAIRNFNYHNNAHNDEIKISELLIKSSADQILYEVLQLCLEITSGRCALLWVPTENSLKDLDQVELTRFVGDEDFRRSEMGEILKEKQNVCLPMHDGFIDNIFKEWEKSEACFLNITNEKSLIPELKAFSPHCIYLPIPKNPNNKMTKHRQK